MIQEIWKRIESITPEVLGKAEVVAAGFEPLDIPLPMSMERSFVDLSWVTSQLREAIEQDKLSKLPTSRQTQFLAPLDEVNARLSSMIEGADDRKALFDAIEKLYGVAWDNGLQNLVPGLLGYQQKLNDLKELEAENIRIRKDLAVTLSTAISIAADSQKAKENSESISADAETSKRTLDQITKDQAAANAASVEADSTLKKIKDANTEAGEFRARAETAASDALSKATEVNKFFEDISKYRSEMTAATAESRSSISTGKQAISSFLESSDNTFASTIKDFQDKTEEAKAKRQQELEELDSRMASKEELINEQLVKATGKSLFHSFDTRKKQIRITKWVWAFIVFALFGVAAEYVSWLSSWLYDERISGITPAIYLRFSVALPLAGAVWFALSQYAKERRFEEEYAFRSNISVSLVPYRDEVAKLLESEKSEENTKLAEFVVRSIDRVFTLPSELNQKPVDKIEDMVSRFADLPKEVIEKLPEILKAINPKGK